MMNNLFEKGSACGGMRESHSQPRVIETLNDDLPSDNESYQNEHN